MVKEYNIEGVTMALADDKIKLDAENAYIHTVLDSEKYDIDAVTCAARPVEFSIVNKLSNLTSEEVKNACDVCNETKEIGVISSENYHLILSPFLSLFEN